MIILILSMCLFGNKSMCILNRNEILIRVSNDCSPSIRAVVCGHLRRLNSPCTKLVHWRSPTNPSHATEWGTWKTQLFIMVNFLCILPTRKEGRKEDGMFCLWEWRFTLLSSPLIKFCQGDFLLVFYNQLGRNICKKYPCNHLQFTVFISLALKLSI